MGEIWLEMALGTIISFSMYGHDIQLCKKMCPSSFDIHTTVLRAKITWSLEVALKSLNREGERENRRN